ncbi:MAG: hypothetical protein AAGF12_34040 [Myxococcota bacterium]
MRIWIVSALLLPLGACNCGESLEGALNEAVEEAAQQAAEEAANAPPTAEAEPSGTAYTCNQVEANHLCYHVTPIPALVTGVQGGCEMPGGTWTEGESCPTENVVATCEKETNRETRYFYEGVALEGAETSCTVFGGTFTPSS